ncbi:hypothetical protein O6H91_08G004000 [Diphasiastrum complanatum]|uniref:Uncharacterized protein n=1 Tax=Diphasiastrum complanatum TaxID=34168 RepID=A0ACC2CUQ1_DIPCM|nr:hypothetical protein O6H91_08G004000 [Diphasiastrum complanatum]
MNLMEKNVDAISAPSIQTKPEVTPAGFEELQKDRHTRKGKGGWKTCPYIFGNEICEKVGAIGIQVNLVTYLVQQMHMKTARAANTITNFGGTAAIAPLLGAYVADSYLGRYYTIIIGSIFYILGGLVLTFQALFKSLKPPSCSENGNCEAATSAQLSFLYVGFFFLAAGSAGIRPCVAPFGADQFDEQDPKQKKQLESFFNWFYFSLVVSILIAVTALVYVQDNAGWSWGFGIPAICMLISLVVFFMGSPLYRRKPPMGSPFAQLAQVIVAAIRKRNLELPSDSNMLYELHNEELGVAGGARLPHTPRLRFLDKAAIITESDSLEERALISRWLLCTVHEVEQLKSLLRMLPLFSSGILYFASSAQHGTFWVQQARTLDRYIRPGFFIPPGSMSFFSNITMLLWIPVYDRIILPFVKRITGRGITFLQRIGIGLFFSITVMIAAAFSEMKRQAAARNAGLLDHPHKTIPTSVFILIPQYILAGLADAFVNIGFLEFFYDQTPDSMRSMAIAIFWTMIAAGNYLSSFLVFSVSKATALHGNWVADNLNGAHLNYFYWLFAALLTVNLLVFQVFARWYTYQGSTCEECNHHPKGKEETELALA